ncbi:hypothetical protein P7C70_g8325, partial [Phenoliferia sp. Uapishka_3]
MATIHDLPAEIITHILGFVHTRFAFNSYADAEPVRDLGRATRVSKRFRACGQPLLWWSIRLRTYKAAKKLLASPDLGRYHTDELEIYVCYPDHTERESEQRFSSYSAILYGLKGVKNLCMSGTYKSVDTAWIGAPNLRGLEYLNINIEIEDSPIPTPHFALSSLALGPSTVSPSFIHSIFTSSSHSLTYLKIDPYFEGNPVLNSLPLLYNTLEFLKITDNLPGLEVLLPSFTALTEFSIDMVHYGNEDVFEEFIDNIFIALPSSVTWLELSLHQPEEVMMSSMEHIVECLNGGKVGWEKLTELDCGLWVGGAVKEGVQELEGWEELVEVCEEREVVLTAVRNY